MSIDSSGNIHKGAGAPGGGQFAGRVNAAPTAGLEGGITREDRVARHFAQKFNAEVGALEAARARVRAAQLEAFRAGVLASMPNARTARASWDDESGNLTVDYWLDDDGNSIDPGSAGGFPDATLDTFDDFHDARQQFERNDADEFIVPITPPLTVRDADLAVDYEAAAANVRALDDGVGGGGVLSTVLLAAAGENPRLQERLQHMDLDEALAFDVGEVNKLVDRVRTLLCEERHPVARAISKVGNA